MVNYILQRLVAAAFVILLLSIVSFSLVRIMPGDPALAYFGSSLPSPEELEAVREQLGLNEPWLTQYLSWMGGVLQGDFGRSLSRPYEIGEQLAARIPVSIQLGGTALVLAVLIGVPAGMLAAVRAGGWVDAIARGGAFVFIGIPGFVLATVVILGNAATLKLPLIGYVPFAENPVESMLRILIPALVLALPMAALISRYTRGSVLDVLSQDFIRTARAKGVPRRRLVRTHAFKNSLIPVSTVIGIEAASIVGGAVVIERVFVIPGVGNYLIDAINMTDYPSVQASILVIGTAYVFVNLINDLLYPVIDPRISYGKG